MKKEKNIKKYIHRHLRNAGLVHPGPSIPLGTEKLLLILFKQQ